ncbi:MAG: Rdx family protein [bacterium]
MAAGLAAAIEKEFQVKAQLIPSDGGVFDVTVDGALVYSKDQTGRHIRDNEEVLALIHERRRS